METTIIVKGIEQKQSKTGRTFWSIDTDQGKMSLFDQPLLINFVIGKSLNIDFTEANGFKNIHKVLDGVKTEKPNQAVQSDKFTEAREEKNRTMYVSYSKDFFIEIYNIDQMKPKEMDRLNAPNVMNLAVLMIKQAIKEF